MLRTLLARIVPQNDGWLAALFGAGTAGVWLPGSLFVGTFITEDLSCVAAGIFAAEGRIDIVSATIACTLGIWLGDIGLYLIGWLSARGLLRWGWARMRAAVRCGTRWSSPPRRRFPCDNGRRRRRAPPRAALRCTRPRWRSLHLPRGRRRPSRQAQSCSR